MRTQGFALALSLLAALLEFLACFLPALCLALNLSWQECRLKESLSGGGPPPPPRNQGTWHSFPFRFKKSIIAQIFALR